MTERSLFNAALERTDPAERAGFLEEACGDDLDLRRRVEALLKNDDEAGGFLEPLPGIVDAVREVCEVAANRPDAADGPGATASYSGTPDPADRPPNPRPLAEGPGTRIGPYKLLEKLGEGGFGVVYMAEQEKPLRRRVALKVIKLGMDTDQVVVRFEAERQALALMDHQNIAKVLDAGVTDSGRPYFVMELVKGVPITEYCDRYKLSPRERLELFVPVCQAIQHAHQKGIIHRDIKPSNVLVTSHDDKPVPRVIDFGVAKAIDHRLTERSLFTQFGMIIGTLEYMSPEQAGTTGLDIDTRSDVYSLGVLLYELLTGTTPLEEKGLRQAALEESLRRIREEEPPKPSTRLRDSAELLPSIAAQRKTEPSRLTKLLRGELDWIVMKAIEKDRTRRYETANGFARDVERYLQDEPVEASPPSATYRLRKFARKHRAGLVTVGAFAALLVLGAILSAWQAIVAIEARNAARRAYAAEARQSKEAETQRARAEAREQLAIDAVKKFRDAVENNPELNNREDLKALRDALLKEPLGFFRLLRDQLQSSRDTRPDALARLASANFELGATTNVIGSTLDALRAFKESLAIQETLAQEHPEVDEFQSRLGRSLRQIGGIQRQFGQLDDAIQSYRKAVDVLERLVARNPTVGYQQDLAWAYTTFARLYRYHPDQPTAVGLELQLKSLEIRQRLARDHPMDGQLQLELAESHEDIGQMQSRMGHPDDALESFQKAKEMMLQLSPERNSPHRESLAENHYHIGTIQLLKGQRTEALASFRKAADMMEPFVRENPTHQSRNKLADIYEDMGHSLGAGQPGARLEAHQKALVLREWLARENPTVPWYPTAVARAHFHVGDAQGELGQPVEALQSYQMAAEIEERLAREHPQMRDNVAGWLGRADMATIHIRIGHLLSRTGKKTEALESFQNALAIQERLAQEHPESPKFASAMGNTLSNIAMIDLDQKRYREARAKLGQAIVWQKKALAACPNHPQYRRFLANHLTNLIKAADGLNDPGAAAEAQRALDELEASDPRFAAPDARLAAVLEGDAPKDNPERLALAQRAYDTRRHAAAARLWAEAIDADPKLADDRQAGHRYNAACAAALAGCGKSQDDPAPDEAARAELRNQARAWLDAELTTWTKLLESATPPQRAAIVPTLAHWQADTDLAGVREPQALDALPDPERDGWRTLWKNVAATLARAQEGSP